MSTPSYVIIQIIDGRVLKYPMVKHRRF